MAATRIWSIKGRLDSVINYVTNPEKTDGSKYTDTELQALTDVIDYAEDEVKTHNKVYEIKDTGKYIALKPAFSQRYIRLKSLGENYSEESIKNRIIMTRNGIREFDKPKTDYNAWLKKYEPTKLHGFKALYFHYLYLFGKIRKKETPQRISFYMREELVKFKRYQKQFLFLYNNDIETAEQLKSFKANAENKIDELTTQRKRLYGKDDIKDKVVALNKELRELRKDVRMCDRIMTDIEVIKENTNFVLKFEENEKNKMRKDMSINNFRSK